MLSKASSVQVCKGIFDELTDRKGPAENAVYTVNSASGEVVFESKRRSLLSAALLEPASTASRTLLDAAGAGFHRF